MLLYFLDYGEYCIPFEMYNIIWGRMEDTVGPVFYIFLSFFWRVKHKRALLFFIKHRIR